MIPIYGNSKEGEFQISYLWGFTAQRHPEKASQALPNPPLFTCRATQRGGTKANLVPPQPDLRFRELRNQHELRRSAMFPTLPAHMLRSRREQRQVACTLDGNRQPTLHLRGHPCTSPR